MATSFVPTYHLSYHLSYHWAVGVAPNIACDRQIDVGAPFTPSYFETYQHHPLFSPRVHFIASFYNPA